MMYNINNTLHHGIFLHTSKSLAYLLSELRISSGTAILPIVANV